MDGLLAWADCDEAGDYVVPNVLSPRDLVSRPDNMDETVPHIKFEILKERLSLFYCNLIQHNFVLDMFSIGQICEENFHLFGDVMDDVIKNLDACHG